MEIVTQTVEKELRCVNRKSNKATNAHPILENPDLLEETERNMPFGYSHRGYSIDPTWSDLIRPDFFRCEDRRRLLPVWTHHYRRWESAETCDLFDSRGDYWARVRVDGRIGHEWHAGAARANCRLYSEYGSRIRKCFKWYNCNFSSSISWTLTATIPR